MAHTYKMYEKAAVENKPLRIVEYDENGNPFCYYKGFYRAHSRSFKLYPTVGAFANREERIKTVSDLNVRRVLK